MNTKKMSHQIIWEVSPEEVNVIAKGVKDHYDRARFLLTKIQCVNEKILVCVDEKWMVNRLRPHSNVIVFNEKSIIPIQKYIRNQKFNRAHKSFKREMESLENRILCKVFPECLKNL
jgi:hypothetical protein